jgi:uncharacterized membrane protein YdbT with pleckstrin-like domain
VHHRIDLVVRRRVQSCRTRRSPLQRRSALATLEVDVAGTRKQAPGATPHLSDMDLGEAEALFRTAGDVPPSVGVLRAF